ncbi:hypothetical protein [Falsiroseomonas oryzae]|uniref:hypothetical protein n=1 Tax=Falsiroseomonas oryzae TaxID=2766473 RepID=UPI0022EAA8CB|nr:hypothetical protein [Roseomonas sp. MO-31]
MHRFALGLVVVGLLAILLTVLLVMGDATLPGGVPPFAAALLAGLGGLSLVGGLALLEPRGGTRERMLG